MLLYLKLYKGGIISKEEALNTTDDEVELNQMMREFTTEAKALWIIYYKRGEEFKNGTVSRIRGYDHKKD